MLLPVALTLPKYSPMPPPNLLTWAKLSTLLYMPSRLSGTVSMKQLESWWYGFLALERVGVAMVTFIWLSMS